MSQKCDQCMEQISECLDQGNDLPPKIEAHLESCQECQEFFQMWSGQDDSLATMASLPKRVEVSGSLEEAIVKRAIGSRRSRKKLFVGAWGAIAAAVAIAAVAFSMREDETPKVSETKPAPTQPEEIRDDLDEARLAHTDLEINIDIAALEAKTIHLKKVGSKALRVKAQSYADAVKGLRQLASNF